MIDFQQQAKPIHLALIYSLSIGVGGISWWMASQHVSFDMSFSFVPYVCQFQENMITFLYYYLHDQNK